jgi:tripartite-type tricarboxylate transporter receptor subunit TctC
MPVLALFPHTLPRTTRYDPLTDFTPAATLGELAYGIAVKADNRAQSLGEFILRGRMKGGVTFAPPVLGAPQHMLMLAFAREVDLPVQVVPHRTTTQGLLEVVAGRIDCTMTHMAELSPQVRGGAVRLLAVSSARRLVSFPEVPTLAELGFERYTATEAYSIVLPARAPAEIAAGLHREVERAVADEGFAERLRRQEVTPNVLSPEATAARLRAEHAAWGPIVRASGFTAEE